MDFIEKVVGLMSGKTAQADASAAAAPEPAEQPQDAPAADAAEQDAVQEQKTYTQEEMESLFAERKKEWQAEQDAQEQERLRGLPETERLKQEQLSKDAKIASLEAELSRRDLQADAVAKLEKEGFPVGLANLLTYTDQESMEKSLECVQEIFKASLEAAVKERLRGRTPEGLGGAATRLNMISDPFARAFSEAFKK